jgi:cbb3-type cytochrome oxidase subunit 3
MLKETLSQLDWAAMTTTGLILFVTVFVAVTLYALTRAPKQAEAWARIPLNAETDTTREERS